MALRQWVPNWLRQVAGLLETGLAAHCIDLRWNGERLDCMVPAFGGKVVSEICIPNARPVMAGVRPGILNVEPAETKTPQVIKADASFLDDVVSGEEFLGFKANEESGTDIETAEIIFSAGRGVASDASWNAIQQLAEKPAEPLPGQEALLTQTEYRMNPV